MTVIADESERNVLEKWAPEGSIQYVEWLEEETGADLMITPLQVAPIAPFITKHLIAGAILVQVKRGADLYASADGRAEFSYARMSQAIENAGRPRSQQLAYQKLLLFIGLLDVSPDKASVLFNGKTPPGRFTYAISRGVIQNWILRGGTVDSIPDMSVFQAWIEATERHFSEVVSDKVKYVYPPAPVLMIESDNVDQWGIRQDLIPVRDFRRTLMALPGLGEKRVQSLYSFMVGAELPLTLMEAFSIITDPGRCKEIPTLSVNISMKIREWFGLHGTLTDKGIPSEDEIFEMILVV